MTTPLRLCLCWLLTLAWSGVASALEPAPEPKTLMTERGPLLLKEDFSEPPAREWKVEAPGWETVDGVLKATHTPPFARNHGPVMERRLPMRNVVVQLELELEGKAHAVLHFNKANGHLCRALLRPDAFYLVRRDSGGDKGTWLDVDQSPIAPGVWHLLVVELYGREMVASLDGTRVLFGQRDDLDQEKPALLLEAGDGTAWFKNLRVWEALPNPGWDATRATLQAARPPAK